MAVNRLVGGGEPLMFLSLAETSKANSNDSITARMVVLIRILIRSCFPMSVGSPECSITMFNDVLIEKPTMLHQRKKR